MKYFNTLTFLLLITSLFSQRVTQELEEFNSLDVATGVEVNLRQGEPRADINVKKGNIEDLIVEVNGSELKIKFKNNRGWNWSSGSRHAKIDLYCGDLKSIETSSGASVESDFIMSTKHFSADASSGSTISISVESNSFTADVSSGSVVEVDGVTDELEVDASSGASFRGVRMKAKEVNADVSSGASIKVWSTDKFEGGASSGGSIKYKGNPKYTNIDSGKWSGGSIVKI